MIFYKKNPKNLKEVEIKHQEMTEEIKRIMDDNYKKFSIHFSCFGIRDLIKQFSNPVVRVNLTGENYEEQEIYIEDES